MVMKQCSCEGKSNQCWSVYWKPDIPAASTIRQPGTEALTLGLLICLCVFTEFLMNFMIIFSMFFLPASLGSRCWSRTSSVNSDMDEDAKRWLNLFGFVPGGKGFSSVGWFWSSVLDWNQARVHGALKDIYFDSAVIENRLDQSGKTSLLDGLNRRPLGRNRSGTYGCGCVDMGRVTISDILKGHEVNLFWSVLLLFIHLFINFTCHHWTITIFVCQT